MACSLGERLLLNTAFSPAVSVEKKRQPSQDKISAMRFGDPMHQPTVLIPAVNEDD